MASWLKIVLAVVYILVIFSLMVQEVQCRRGSSGGRRSSSIRVSFRRTSSRHFSSSSSTRRFGSSPYSINTWKAAAMTGAIYGGMRYMRTPYYRKYPDKLPPICTNNYDVPPNGTKPYGYFICPLEFDPDNYTYCCGDDKDEFCCDESYYRQTEGSSSEVPVFVIVATVILAIGIVICIIYSFIKSKRMGTANFFRSLTSRKSARTGGPSELTDARLAVPLKSYEETPVFNGQPNLPGPYGDPKGGYPGNYPPGNYPPGNYPPQFAPNPSDPYAQSAPYPPSGDPGNAMPYPAMPPPGPMMYGQPPQYNGFDSTRPPPPSYSQYTAEAPPGTMPYSPYPPKQE